VSMSGSFFFSCYVYLVAYAEYDYFFSYPVFFATYCILLFFLVVVSSILFLEALMKCLTLSSSALQFFL